MMKDDEDILYMHRPISKVHRQMTIYERAAQFMPFSALTGLDESLKEVGRSTIERIELSENELDELKHQLDLLHILERERPLVTITYFVQDTHKSGGTYEQITNNVYRVDGVAGNIIFIDKSIVEMKNIIAIEMTES